MDEVSSFLFFTLHAGQGVGGIIFIFPSLKFYVSQGLLLRILATHGAKITEKQTPWYLFIDLLCSKTIFFVIIQQIILGDLVFSVFVSYLYRLTLHFVQICINERSSADSLFCKGNA